MYVVPGGSMTAASYSTPYNPNLFQIDGYALLGPVSFTVAATRPIVGAGTLSVTSLYGGQLHHAQRHHDRHHDRRHGRHRAQQRLHQPGHHDDRGHGPLVILRRHGLTGSPTTFDTTGGSITLSGVLSGAGGLNKAGPGTLLLSNANTYTGGTTVMPAPCKRCQQRPADGLWGDAGQHGRGVVESQRLHPDD